MPRMGRRGPVRKMQRRRRRRRTMVAGAMVVGAGTLAYKLGKNQTKQVEEASGMPIEEMTDEEIQKYVKENNIETEPLDENDKAAIAESGES
jgi:3'-phosphoadenosine 5'-phosphosulfate sulfotransferase (PAPS reductase)/FAD synthetase